MSEPKGSWSKNYEEVDFGVSLFQSPHHEGEAMLQSPSTPKTSTTPEPLDLPALPRPAKHHSSYIHGPLTHEASSSNSPIDSTPLGSPTPDLTFSLPGNGNFHPRSQRTTVSSIKSFASSPLKPTAPSSFPTSPFNRSASRGSAHINRIASEECRALAAHQSLTHSGSRGSMILYRCVDSTTDDNLLPPTRSHLHRNSVLSTSGDSIVSLSSDSKYPAATIASDRGLIAYAYDPSLDELGSSAPTDDDYLHEPDDKFPQQSGLLPSVSSRGVINILTLVALIAAILCLFVVYPVVRFYHDNGRNLLITFNTKINISGQAISDTDMTMDRRSQILFAAPIPLIDSSTPLPARILKTAQDIIYELLFSDEFAQNGRSFSAGQEPIWETDVYEPSQIDTKDRGSLVRLDTLSGSALGQSGLRGESREEDKGIRTDMGLSGILKMKVPLCLSRGGFVEVGLGTKDVGLDPWSGSKRGEVEEEEDGGTLRRLIYWPGSSYSWSSLNQTGAPNIPADVLSMLTSNSDFGTSLTLSIGIPIDDVGRTRLVTTGSSDPDSDVTGSEPWSGERRSMSKRVETEVDYIRIYQPIKSSSVMLTEEGRWECAAAQDESIMLDLLEV